MCEKIKCPKCGGKGYIPQYNHVEDGICFDYSGSGWINKKEYEHMIEQQATKDIKRLSKQESNLKAARDFYTDVLYLVIGNTYSIKNELKANGAKWNFWMTGWTFTEPKENYKTIAINYNDVKDFSINELDSYLKERGK